MAIQLNEQRQNQFLEHPIAVNNSFNFDNKKIKIIGFFAALGMSVLVLQAAGVSLVSEVVSTLTSTATNISVIFRNAMRPVNRSLLLNLLAKLGGNLIFVPVMFTANILSAMVIYVIVNQVALKILSPFVNQQNLRDRAESVATFVMASLVVLSVPAWIAMIENGSYWEALESMQCQTSHTEYCATLRQNNLNKLILNNLPENPATTEIVNN